MIFQVILLLFFIGTAKTQVPHMNVIYWLLGDFFQMIRQLKMFLNISQRDEWNILVLLAVRCKTLNAKNL